MLVAPKRVGTARCPQDAPETGLFFMFNRPRFDLVRIDGKTTSEENRIVTLAWVRVPNDLKVLDTDTDEVAVAEKDTTVIVAGSIMNPLDQLNRHNGRKNALERLVQYLTFGTVRKHKDGRSADHFIVELSPDEITKGWRRRVGQAIYDASFLGTAPKECCAQSA